MRPKPGPALIKAAGRQSRGMEGLNCAWGYCLETPMSLVGRMPHISIEPDRQIDAIWMRGIGAQSVAEMVGFSHHFGDAKSSHDGIVESFSSNDL